MSRIENAFLEFTDAIQTAGDAAGLRRVGTRLARQLGFRWFAYLSISGGDPFILSAYPSDWVRRYVQRGYALVDPVVRRAGRERTLFSWDGRIRKPPSTREQGRFFDEAMVFGVRSGITVPIKGAFGSTIAFTLAHDESISLAGTPARELLEIVQSAGVHFHAHATARLSAGHGAKRPTKDVLTQRERQCLVWIAEGKTVPETARLVGIAPSTVSFHLENARRKLEAVSIAHCVGEAMRRGLLT
ncbi:LuxR family transcriptional regulator [Bradyrhizobium prioriisuperbiae]|uniref:helix-turn-helix transcriptional regulator n=1 Tax=Bradyrhizobium prioriisuperbiae TaxID=2854389 RepID=UPI0028E4AB7C|nr:LuxR family transcriptional regulator [Bradyrhizobium prioritasuperba]